MMLLSIHDTVATNSGMYLCINEFFLHEVSEFPNSVWLAKKFTSNSIIHFKSIDIAGIWQVEIVIGFWHNSEQNLE